MTLLVRRSARLGLVLCLMLLVGAIGYVRPAWSRREPLARAVHSAPALVPEPATVAIAATSTQSVSTTTKAVSTTPPAPAPEMRAVTPPVPSQDRITAIPVLMYHEIGDVNNNNYVRLAEFEEQVRWLADNGYHTVTLAEAYGHFHDFKPLPAKPVVLTFDDGYATFHDIVVPELQKHGFRATAFIVTGLLGRPSFMTWDQVIDIANQGMEIGSHSLTHPDLRTITGERLVREITEPKRLLEERTKVPVQFFCYPSGKYNGETLAVVKQAGYLGAVTTDYGPITPEQSTELWPRVRILRGETSASFATKIQRASGK